MTKTSPNNHELLDLIDDISFIRSLLDEIEKDSSMQQHLESMQELEQQALLLLAELHEIKQGTHRVKVAIIGGFSSGKSSFINALLGRSVCPVGVGATTSSITTFYYGDKEKIVEKTQNKDLPLTLREYQDKVQHPKNSSGISNVREFEFYYPFEGLRNIELVDTPGFENKNNAQDTEITLALTKQADAIFFVFDANAGEISLSIQRTLRTIRQDKDARWYALVNKVDGKTTSGLQKIVDKIKSQYKDFFLEVHLYSAKKSLEEVEQGIEQASLRMQKFFQENIKLLSRLVEETNQKEIKASLNLEISSQKNSTDVSVFDQRKLLESFRALHPPKKMEVSREHLIQTLLQIGEQKSQIASLRLQTQRKHYKRIFNSYMKMFLKSIQQNRSSPFPAFQHNHFEKALDEIYDNTYKTFENLTLHLLSNSGVVREIPSERKHYYFSPYYEISFKPSYVQDYWDKSEEVWLFLEKELLELYNAIKEEIPPRASISLSKKSFKVNFKESIISKSTDLLQEFYLKTAPDSFESQEEAKGYFSLMQGFLHEKIFHVCLEPIQGFFIQLKQSLAHYIGMTKGSISSSGERKEALSRKVELFLTKRA